MPVCVSTSLSHVAQQLLGAGLGQLGHTLPVAAESTPVEIRQPEDSAVPAQQLEESGGVEPVGAVADTVDQLVHAGDDSGRAGLSYG